MDTKLLQRLFGTSDVNEIIGKKETQIKSASRENPVERAISPKIHKVKLSPEECKGLCNKAKIIYKGKETIGDETFLGYEDRVYEYVFTDATVDRYGDVVLPEGGDLKNYKKNPVVLGFHEGRKLPVGNSIKTWYDKNDESIRGWVLFLDNRVDKTGLSETIFQYASNGHMKTGSIGFMPDFETEGAFYRPDEEERKSRKMGKYGYVFAKWELLEFSVTPIPANPSASQKDLDPKYRSIDDIFAYINKELIPEEKTDDMSDMISSIKRQIEALKTIEEPKEEKENNVDIKILRELITIIKGEERTQDEKITILCENMTTLTTKLIILSDHMAELSENVKDYLKIKKESPSNGADDFNSNEDIYDDEELEKAYDIISRFKDS